MADTIVLSIKAKTVVQFIIGGKYLIHNILFENER